MPMDSNTRKILFPLLIGMFACFILGVVVFGPASDDPAGTPPSDPVEQAADPDPPRDPGPESTPSTEKDPPASTSVPSSGSVAVTSPPAARTPSTPVEAPPPAEPPPGGFGTLFAAPSG